MRVGSAACGSSSFDLTLTITALGNGAYELVHTGSAMCSSLSVTCQTERLQVQVDPFGLVVDEQLLAGMCIYSSDVAQTPRAVVRRSFGSGVGTFTENVNLEGTEFPNSATFEFP